MFLLVSVRHVGAHPGEHQHGVSIQISISLGKTFLRISHIQNIPLTWILARPLYMYLLSFPRFWTLSIERFWFLFWSILNGLPLKTSNRASSTSITVWRSSLSSNCITSPFKEPVCVEGLSSFDVAWENSLKSAIPPLISPWNDLAAEISGSVAKCRLFSRVSFGVMSVVEIVQFNQI